ncbi:MAG TPA: dienelactone hydrolase family protein [Burkholderiales bacterium]|nr:dienelactone hydrolase family protein [Burkholderiales bacterium]
MNRIIVACSAAFALLSAAPSAAQLDLGFPAEPEREVRLPGRGAFTGARLYAPEGAGPFPAVVLSHTSGALREHVFEWAQRFHAAGYAALIVDHLGPRNKRTNTDFSVSVTEYAQDDVAAMRHLRTLPFVDGKRIVQMGFSYGGMAGLREASKDFRDRNLGGERFAAIVSVYPWCHHQGPGRERRDHHWNFFDDTDIPLLVLVGADDDEADPRSCITKAKANAGRGLPVELAVFPNTTHAYDHSWMGDKPVMARLGNRMVTYRFNRESVEASWKLTLDFLARHLKQ